MLIKELKIGDKILVKNNHNHIKIYLVKAIKNRTCQLHGEYIGKEYHLQKIRQGGTFGSTSVYSEDSEISAEKITTEKYPICQCGGCNSVKTKNIPQEE